MEIIFKGRQTDVAARFRDYATAKLTKLEKLDAKAMRVDVEVCVERNPRQASQKERVELTIRSRGPAVRAEAAAEDRMAAFDLALAKLDSRLRRALDRRKSRNGGREPERKTEQRQPAMLQAGAVPQQLAPGRGADDPAAGALAGADEPSAGTGPAGTGLVGEGAAGAGAAGEGAAGMAAAGAGARRGRGGATPATEHGGTRAERDQNGDSDSVVPIRMEGDGPLVVRQKFHRADPIPIDQALLEMELVGHDFYLFHDVDEGVPSVVYRRRGYHYGVIRLVENGAGNGVPGGAAEAAVAGRRAGDGS